MQEAACTTSSSVATAAVGPESGEGLIEGLRKAGRNVIDIGMAPTPWLYFRRVPSATGCCVSVTGSHNPPDYNGFKIVVGGETLSGDAITDLYARIAEDACTTADAGQLSIATSATTTSSASPATCRSTHAQGRVDCGNGVAGASRPSVLQRSAPRSTAVLRDRRHLPEPPSGSERAAQPQDLIQRCGEVGADLGIALRRRRRPPRRGHARRRDDLSRPPADAVRRRRARAQSGRADHLRRQMHRRLPGTSCATAAAR
jgi:phosphomannomutase